MSVEGKDTLEIRMVVNIVLMSLIGIVCLIGNILVIRALIFSKYPRIPIYIAIGGLALADMLNIIIEIPYIVLDQLGLNNMMNTPLCKAHFYLTSVCKIVAALHLVLFSIIRCIMLNDRVRSRSYVLHTLVASIVIWIVISLTNVLSLKSLKFNDALNICVEPNTDVTSEDERILWLRFSFSYIGPLIVIIALYIVTKVLSMRFYDESYSSRERRFSRMVTFIVVIFAIFKLPYNVIEVMIFYKVRYIIILHNENIDPEQELDTLDTYFKISGYTTCVFLIDLALRPIIYAKFSYYFGQSFDEVLNCNSCREQKPRPKRRKNDSGVSNHTDLIEEDRKDMNGDQILESDNDLDQSEDAPLEETNVTGGEAEKFLETEKVKVDVEQKALDHDYKPLPISLFITSGDSQKDIPMFYSSLCGEEKNGENGRRVGELSLCMLEGHEERNELKSVLSSPVVIE